MNPLYTQELADELVALLNGLEFLESRNVNTTPIVVAILNLITVVCHFDREQQRGNSI